MPRPLTGTIKTRDLADGSTAFDVKIRSDLYTLGRAPDWSRQRAKRFLESTLLPAAMLHHDWWELIPSDEKEDKGGVTVWQALTEYVEWRKAKSANPNTRNAAESPVVKHLLPFFAFVDPGRTVERLLQEVNDSLVASFIERKRWEREVLIDLAEKLSEASDEELRDIDKLAASETLDVDSIELELLRRYGQQGGRYKLADPEARGRISLSSRGLGASEINRCLTTLSTTVLRANRRHGLQIPDPTYDMRLKTDGPDRNWLWPDHLEVLAQVAREMDVPGGHFDHNGREAAVLVFGLCGPRVHEFCAFDWADLSDAGLTVRRSKTDAGKRTIQVPKIARDALNAHRERLGNPAADTPIWPTSTGRRRRRDSVRNRLLAPLVDRARPALEASDVTEALPARLTPHTFRRTAATYWYWLGRDARATMYEIGHRNSQLTLEVYAQPRPRDQRQKEMLTAWMEGAEI